MDIKEIESFEFGTSPELRRRGELAFKRNFKALHHLSPDNVSTLDEGSLKEGRRSVEDAMESMLNKCEVEKRNMTENEEWAYRYSEYMLDRYNTAFDKMKGITRSVKQNIINPIGSDMFLVSAERRPLSNSRSYRGMFYGNEQAGLDDGGFKSINEFFGAIASQRHDPRLDECQKRTQQITVGSEGGFAAPDFHGGWLLDNSLSKEIIRNLAMVVPLKGASNTYVMWDNQTQNNSVFGGFSGEWLAEGQEASIETAKIRSVNFTPHKLGIFAEITREAMQDTLDLGGQLTAALVRSISYLLDEAFIAGNGAGRPLGIINSPSRIDVTRATPNTISYADLYGMFAALHPSAENAVWLASLSTLPQLLTLKDASNNLIFLPASFQGISAPLPGSIFGKKLIFTDKLPVLGNRADLVLCDPSVGYLVGMRSELIVQSSNSPGFLRDVETFRILLRADAASTFSKPITMRDGNLASWCVCLN
jgi:HK97 family phage major capsid protein